MAKINLTLLPKILPLALLLVVLAMPSSALSGCPSASTYYENHLSGCWSCTLFRAVFDAINDYASATYDRIAKPCISLMAIFVAIYLAVFVMHHISALKEHKLGEFLTALLGLLLKCMIVSVLLGASAGTFSNLIISPIIITTADISSGILESFTTIKDQMISAEEQKITPDSSIQVCTKDGSNCQSPQMKVCDDQGNCKIQNVDGSTTFTPIYCDRMKESVATKETGVDSDENTKMLDDQTYNALMCIINNMHYEAAFPTALGDAMMCYAWSAERLNFFVWSVPWLSISMLLTGLIIFAVSLFISIAYVFKLIDGIFRLGILLILLPLLAVAWVFPPTVEFAKKGFTMLIHVMMLFISLALVVSIALMLVMVAFTNDASNTSLYQLFNENRIYDMKDIIDFFSTNFLFAIVSLFIAVKLLDVADHIATEFSGVDIGTGVGDQLSMTFTNVATHTARGALTVGKIGVLKMGSAAKDKFAGTGFGSRIAGVRNRFHNASTSANYHVQQKLGFAPPSVSSAPLTANEHKAAYMAGTDQKVAAQRSLDTLNSRARGDSATINKLEKDANYQALCKRDSSGRLLKDTDGHLIVDDAKVKATKAQINIATALEEAGANKFMSQAQKEQIMLTTKPNMDKDALNRVSETDISTLNRINKNKLLNDQKSLILAEKFRNGETSDTETQQCRNLMKKDKDFLKMCATNGAELTNNKNAANHALSAGQKLEAKYQKQSAEITHDREQIANTKNLKLQRDKAIAAGDKAKAAKLQMRMDKKDPKYQNENFRRQTEQKAADFNSKVKNARNNGWQVGETSSERLKKSTEALKRNEGKTTP